MVKRIKKFKPTLEALNSILYCEGITTIVTKAHCETYGPKTMAYLRVADMTTRLRLEDNLSRMGIYTNPHYCRKSGGCLLDEPRLEIQVRYFRARGWNA
jgi:hypothetical protein